MTSNISNDFVLKRELEFEDTDFKWFHEVVDPVLNGHDFRIAMTAFNEETGWLGKVKSYISSTTAPSNIIPIRETLTKLESDFENLKVVLADDRLSDKERLNYLKQLECLITHICHCKKSIIVGLKGLFPDLSNQLTAEIERYEHRLMQLNENLAEIQKAINAIEHSENQETQKQHEAELERERNIVRKKWLECLNSIPDAVKHDPRIAEEKALIENEINALRGAPSKNAIEQSHIMCLVNMQAYQLKAIDLMMEKRAQVKGSFGEIFTQINERASEIAFLRKNMIDRSKQYDLGAMIDLTSNIPLLIGKKFGVENSIQLRLWGRILVPTDTKDNVKSWFSKDFVSTVDRLRAEKNKIKQELKGLNQALAAGTANPEQEKLREQLSKKEVDIKRLYYHTLLQRMIDVIGEREWQLRQNKQDGVNDPNIELDLIILNFKFDKILLKYKGLPEDKRTLVQSLKARGMEVATLGYYRGNMHTYQQFLAYKQYADMGYSMVNYIQKWFSETRIAAGKDPLGYLRDEIKLFLKWAEDHPERAAIMSADIAQTCAIVAGDDKQFLQDFQAAMRSKAITMAFHAPFGGPDWEMVESERELKFKALADLCRYAPGVAGASSSVVQEISQGNLSPVALMGKALVKGLRAGAVQQVGDLIPAEWGYTAARVVDVVKGKSYHELLEAEHSVELARAAGIAKKAIISPSNLIDQISTGFAKWRRTIVKSKGWERFTRIMVQAVVPTLCVAGIAGLIALTILGGPITIGVAIAAGLILLGVTRTVLLNSEGWMRKIWYNTGQVVDKEFGHTAEEKVIKQLQKQQSEKLEEIKKKMILEYQSTKLLPYIKKPDPIKLSSEQQSVVDFMIRSETRDVLKKLYRPPSKDKEDIISHFNECFKLEDLKNQLQKFMAQNSSLSTLTSIQRENIRGYILYKVTQELIDQWVGPNLERQVIKNAVCKNIDRNDEKKVRDEREEHLFSALRAPKNKISEQEARVALTEYRECIRENRDALETSAAAAA